MKGYYREFFLFPDISVLVVLILGSIGALLWNGITWGDLGYSLWVCWFSCLVNT